MGVACYPLKIPHGLIMGANFRGCGRVYRDVRGMAAAFTVIVLSAAIVSYRHAADKLSP